MSIPNANVSGTIAIRGVDGRYLKVLPNDGLAFGSQKLDDTAKFQVKKYDNGKIGIIGSNGKYVNMYYNDDVQCKGPSGGVGLNVVYLADGLVNFTISGVQGMDGRTKYLSSFAGSEAYDGSLAVVAFEDITCRFKIQNF